MGIWLEVHCDVGLPGQHPTNILRPRCVSHENGGPMAMAANRQISVIVVLRRLDDEAKKRGWAKVGGQWVCPGCRGMKEY
jgi:hypothetical protein